MDLTDVALPIAWTLTGMVLTLAVVYRPSWVATFDDARYIKGR